MKKKKYNFPGYSSEDLSQDIRLICWESLQKFQPDKMGKSLFHFVAKCVDNALYNQFRGTYLDNNPPCLRCPHYIKPTKECAINESGCDRIVQYRNRMARKRAIDAPLSYNSYLDDDEKDFSQHSSLSVASQTGVCDLDDIILSSLDESLILYYTQIKNGDNVPLHIKRLVAKQVRIILDDM